MFDDILAEKKTSFDFCNKDFTLIFWSKSIDGEWKWFIEEIKCGCVGVVFED